jgi:hypothetical protein
MDKEARLRSGHKRGEHGEGLGRQAGEGLPAIDGVERKALGQLAEPELRLITILPFHAAILP